MENLSDTVNPKIHGGISAVDGQGDKNVVEVNRTKQTPLAYSTSIASMPFESTPVFSLETQVSTKSAPPGTDTSSYIAGERDALAKAFGAILPSQQALGQLFQAVDGVQARMAEEAAIVRSLQTHSASLTESVHGISTRISTLEEIAIPTISSRCDELAGRTVVDTELLSAVHSLRDVLHDIAVVQARSQVPRTTGFARLCIPLLSRLQSTILVIATQLEGLLVSLSMRWLTSSEQIRHEGQGSATSISQWLRRSTHRTLSGALFIVLVESLWLLQKKAKERLPKPLARLLQPIRMLLKLSRILTWTAVFFLGIHTARTASATAAGKLLLLLHPPSRDTASRHATEDQEHGETDDSGIAGREGGAV